MTVDALAQVCLRPPSTCRHRSPRPAPGATSLVKALIAWPSWFFARGDLAAGGAGDESPLVFDDTTLSAEPTHAYQYRLGLRPGRGRPLTPRAGPWTVHLTVDTLNPASGRDARHHLAESARRHPRRGAARTGGPHGRPDRRGAPAHPGPILSTVSLRSILPADVAATLAFGTSPDGSAIGPDDFATTRADVVCDRRAGRRRTAPSSTWRPSLGRTETPWCA